MALVDGASFVLPYDTQLVLALRRLGAEVTLYASRTRYNGECLAELAVRPGVRVVAAGVSRSVAPRWRGVLAYAWLLLLLAAAVLRGRHDLVWLQFAPAGAAEWPLWALLRRRLVFTVHNPVPHGHTARTHAPTQALAALARRVVFASEAACDEFHERCGDAGRPRALVMPHGLLPPDAARPEAAAQPYSAARWPAPDAPLVFWGNVQGYKGVELFEALAADPALRARGLEVHGAWDPALAPLAARLRAQGVQVHDGFLDAPALAALLARDAVFVLPYTRATQSGALYTLLHAGRVVLLADSGDLGGFARRHGLGSLLLAERSAAAVQAALARLQTERGALAAGLAEAQRQHDWDHALASLRAALPDDLAGRLRAPR